MNPKLSSCLIELHFLPSLEYFCALQSFDKIILEKHESYLKQSYRNRCYILTSHGVERLTIPVAARGKARITDVEIDNARRWQPQFWRAIESAYAKSPYFEHYRDDLNKEIFFGHTHLYLLNFRLMSMCLQWLGWTKMVSESVTYEKNLIESIDLRNHVSAKKDYLQRELYHPRPYRQVFGSNFAPNLSLLDLVFCEGPGAQAVIRDSESKRVNK